MFSAALLRALFTSQRPARKPSTRSPPFVKTRVTCSRAAIRVRSVWERERVVVSWQEAGRGGRVRVGQRAVRHVDELGAALVAEGPKLRPQPLEHLAESRRPDHLCASLARAGPNAARWRDAKRSTDGRAASGPQPGFRRRENRPRTPAPEAARRSGRAARALGRPSRARAGRDPASARREAARARSPSTPRGRGARPASATASRSTRSRARP